MTSHGGEKSPEAFRTISEVAEMLEMPQHVLRFWETRFNQVKPLKRGGNRRYYRPEDIELLRTIRHLLYSDGYTIKGVQKLLRENGLRATVEATLAAGIPDLAPPVVQDEMIRVIAPANALVRQQKLNHLADELRAIRALLDQAVGA